MYSPCIHNLNIKIVSKYQNYGNSNSSTYNLDFNLKKYNILDNFNYKGAPLQDIWKLFKPMKRNLTLIKDIFCLIEDSQEIAVNLHLNDEREELLEYSPAEVTYHLQLLSDGNAGYITMDVVKAEDEPAYYAVLNLKMTFKGTEFLEVLKNKEGLNKLLSFTKEGISGLTLDLVKDLLKKITMKQAEKYIGI